MFDSDQILYGVIGFSFEFLNLFVVLSQYEYVCSYVSVVFCVQ